MPNFRLRWLRLLEAGAPAAAVEQFKRHLRAQPASEVRMLLAQALAQVGCSEDAEVELRAVLAEAPDEADVHAGLGLVIG